MTGLLIPKSSAFRVLLPPHVSLHNTQAVGLFIGKKVLLHISNSGGPHAKSFRKEKGAPLPKVQVFFRLKIIFGTAGLS